MVSCQLHYTTNREEIFTNDKLKDEQYILLVNINFIDKSNGGKESKSEVIEVPVKSDKKYKGK